MTVSGKKTACTFLLTETEKDRYISADGGLLAVILSCLEDSRAGDVVSLDLRGRSALADFMVIASGRSGRHITAISDQLLRQIKMVVRSSIRVEGLESGDWVLVDTGDVIIHLFREEVRMLYNLEKIWIAPETAASASGNRKG